MRFETVRDAVAGVPHMSQTQARTVYDHLLAQGATRLLELGFAHGTSTCYFAAAMQETGGSVVTIDRASAMSREPNVEQMLDRIGLGHLVDVVLEPTSYTWALMRMLEQDPQPRFDFVYVDGAHLWDVDGFAFFLLDRLVEPGGWVLFDDMNWTLESSPSMAQQPAVRALPELQRNTPQIRKVFELLVRTHPSYGEFRDEAGWGWARKRRTELARAWICVDAFSDAVYGEATPEQVEGWVASGRQPFDVDGYRVTLRPVG